MASIRSLSSRWLAACWAAGYVVVSAVLGAALLVRPEVPSAASPASSPPTYTAEDSRATTAPQPPPHGFQRVAGPAKVQTVIPIGWRIARAGGPGAMRASDPSDAGRFLGYGGAPAGGTDIIERHVTAETRFADRTAAYRRIILNRATYGGHPAIEWEYEHNDGSGVQHVCALYWVVDGTEYFIYVSGSDASWPGMKPVYDAMVANSRP